MGYLIRYPCFKSLSIRPSGTAGNQICSKFSQISPGDIAVDDIKFQNCELPSPQETCGDTQYQCDNGGCISKGRVCDYQDDCGDFSDEKGGKFF